MTPQPTTTTPPGGEQENGFGNGNGNANGNGTVPGPGITKKLSRKSHRKSRNGCQNCKQRKIKCDEQKPQCANCSRHSVHCRYPHGSPQVSSPEPTGIVSPPLLAPNPATILAPASNVNVHMSGTGPSDIVTRPNSQPQVLAPLASQSLAHMGPRVPSPPRPVLVDPQLLPQPQSQHQNQQLPPFQPQQAIQAQRPYRQPLNVTDLELLHHYNISTCYTLANDSQLQTCFRINVPQIGCSYPFVLHGILSLASLHLSRFKHGSQRAHYINEAQYHYNTALHQASGLMSNINAETCPSLYLFTVFCLYITLGLGPRAGDFLIFGEEGLAEWLVLFKGMKSIVESCGDDLRNSDLAPMFQIQRIHVDQPPQPNTHLDSLRQLILSNCSTSPDLDLYLSTLSSLARSFPPPAPSSFSTAQASPHTIFAWLYRLDDVFIDRLRQREDVALVILAHFCVLFNSLSSFWWTQGWVNHLMGEIYGGLKKERRVWLTWPMEEIGWIPS